jgi:hypothetical protein
VALHSKPVATRGSLARRLIATALLGLGGACGGRDEGPGKATGLHEARVSLGASFVGGQASGLRRLLHRDLIVQPPEPDTALRGDSAAEYLERLARESQVTRSELLPASVSREGGFLLERGWWYLGLGDRTLASRYIIRWRESPAGWSVVLWRWTLFRHANRPAMSS